MEKKSMGQFIAVLRKAKGMTQRELAEMLGVSDKAVSRWERDECAPDISALPVLAEIFDITVDELLRGERSAKEEAPTKGAVERSEKQLKRLLKLSREKYQKRSIISVGIALVGLIAGSICNFAFLRSYLGCYLSLPFILGGAICQSIFTIDAFSALRDSEVEEDTLLREKKWYISIAYFIFSLIILILLPCIIFGFSGGAYYGIEFDDWLGTSAVFSLILAVVLLSVYAILLSALKKKNSIYVPQKEKEKAPELKRLFRVQFIKAVALFALSVTALTVCTTAIQKSHGQKFTDLEEFKTFMETPVEYRDYALATTMTVPTVTEAPATEYEEADVGNYEVYDEYAESDSESDLTEIADYIDDYIETETYFFEDGYLKEKLLSEDGSEVILEYVHRNEAVSSMQIDWVGGEPIIYVLTFEEARTVNELGNRATGVFFAAVIVEAVALAVDYMRKRKRILGE